MILLVLKLAVLSLVACSPTVKHKEGAGIVGGEDIDIKDAPHQVELLFKDSFTCGGSVIDKEIIITAAHCSKLSQNFTQYKVRVGSTYLSKGGQIVAVSDVRFNSNFTKKTLDYDVGLLRLSEPLTFSDVVKPIQMADVGDEIPDGADTSVTGWGTTSISGNVSEILQRVVIQKITDADCKKSYDWITPITPRMICAGVPEGGKSACHGDSGGPLVYNKRLFGIVSWGSNCAKPGYPTVFSKVAALREWIDENIKLMKIKEL